MRRKAHEAQYYLAHDVTGFGPLSCPARSSAEWGVSVAPVATYALPRGPVCMGAGLGPGSCRFSARRRAWPGSASGLRGGWLRGPCPAGFLYRAHQADVVAVGVGHDRVPGAPECVKRRLAPLV